MKHLIRKIIKEEFWDEHEPEFNLEEDNYFLYFDPPIPRRHFNSFLENLHSKGIALDWDYGELNNRNNIKTMYFYGDNYEYYDWDREREERVLRKAEKGKVAIFDIPLPALKNWPFTPYDDNTEAPNFDGYGVLGLNFGGDLKNESINVLKETVSEFDYRCNPNRVNSIQEVKGCLMMVGRDYKSGKNKENLILAIGNIDKVVDVDSQNNIVKLYKHLYRTKHNFKKPYTAVQPIIYTINPI
jgi:hypothetical protein